MESLLASELVKSRSGPRACPKGLEHATGWTHNRDGESTHVLQEAWQIGDGHEWREMAAADRHRHTPDWGRPRLGPGRPGTHCVLGPELGGGVPVAGRAGRGVVDAGVRLDLHDQVRWAETRKIVEPGQDANAPAFSPDGRWLYFQSSCAGPPRSPGAGPTARGPTVISPQSVGPTWKSVYGLSVRRTDAWCSRSMTVSSAMWPSPTPTDQIPG